MEDYLSLSKKHPENDPYPEPDTSSPHLLTLLL